MRIGAIFTGGTIGSCLDQDGRIRPDQKKRYVLLEKNGRADVEYLPREPYYILSENLSLKEWNLLLGEIRSLLKEGVDGILVMHGTDTLAYTAALLDILFAEATCPLVMVSSDFPLTDPRANGWDNFSAAVDFLQSPTCPRSGCFVASRNDDGCCYIHQGSKILQQGAYTADLYSVKDQYFGRMKEGNFLIREQAADQKLALQGRELLHFLLPYKKEVKQRDWDTYAFGEAGKSVIRLSSYVGMLYPDLKQSIGAVLLTGFHSGTLSMGQGLVDFMKEAKKKQIPVFAYGLDDCQAEYETVEIYRGLGAVPLPVGSDIAWYVALLLCFGK